MNFLKFSVSLKPRCQPAPTVDEIKLTRQPFQYAVSTFVEPGGHDVRIVREQGVESPESHDRHGHKTVITAPYDTPEPGLVSDSLPEPVFTCHRAEISDQGHRCSDGC